jgi:hypothetical protein
LLSNLSDGSTRSEKNVSGKFEGTANGAAKKALEEGSRLLLKELNNLPGRQLFFPTPNTSTFVD